MGLTVTVLGASGSYPGPGGACSGYLLDDGTTRVWVDAGSGTLANLQRHIGLDQLDAIVLSHEHPDHWSDLEAWHVVCRYRLGRTAFPVYAPAGLRDRTYEPDSPALAWHDVAGGDTASVGTMAFTFSRTDHGPETLALRVDAGGRSLGYSADTGAGWSLAALGIAPRSLGRSGPAPRSLGRSGHGLDLALCEATLPIELEDTLTHLTARQAGASAREAGAGRLVLTHLWPTLDPDRSRAEGSEAFGGPVEVASVGARYDV